MTANPGGGDYRPDARETGTDPGNLEGFHAQKAAGEHRDTEGELAQLRAEVARWQDKAQEAGEAYANVNSKHHAELDRANRLERLTDTLAGRAVDLEDRARSANAALTRVREVLDAVEANPAGWGGAMSVSLARSVRAALDGPVTSAASPSPASTGDTGIRAGSAPSDSPSEAQSACWRHDYNHREYICRCVPVRADDSGLD